MCAFPLCLLFWARRLELRPLGRIVPMGRARSRRASKLTSRGYRSSEKVVHGTTLTAAQAPPIISRRLPQGTTNATPGPFLVVRAELSQQGPSLSTGQHRARPRQSPLSLSLASIIPPPQRAAAMQARFFRARPAASLPRASCPKPRCRAEREGRARLRARRRRVIRPARRRDAKT